MQSHHLSLFLMVIILLVATALRAQDLSLMRDMLHYDEAYYGVDALSLLQQPRLTVFFPDNFGREGLWMVLLTPALAIFGATSFALRITALFAGVLTVAAVYRLGRALFGWRAGVWSAAALAVLFWHVLASHQAFRALLYPLVGALAFAALWKRLFFEETQRVPAAAVWFGILAYTYIAARAWIALAAAVVGVALVVRWRAMRVGGDVTSGDMAPPQRTFGIGVGTFVLMVAPLAWTLLANPALAHLRGEQVAIRDGNALVENIGVWAGALVVRGSQDVAYNLPGRPILDLPLALLLLGGAAAWGWRRIRRGGRARGGGRHGGQSHGSAPTDGAGRGAFLFVLALFAASLAPALLTTDPLKPVRAVGAVVPLALLIGVAGAAIGRREWHPTSDLVRKPRVFAPRLIAAGLPLLLLTLAASNTVRDVAAWVRSPDLFLAMEQHLMRGIDRLAAASDGDPVYFSPFTPDHPVIRFRAGDLSPRPVSVFKADECLRLAAGGADYFALTLFDPGFADHLRSYAKVSELWRERLDPPRYALYHAQPDASWFDEPQAAWAEALAVTRVVGVPGAAARGDQLALTFALRALAEAELPPLTLFVHLYGDPTPYEGGVLWAQADMPLCPGSPPATWRTDEVIVQATALTLPPDLPAGRYDLALGIYDSRTGARLPVTTPGAGLDYALVASLAVE